ncbi:MAG: Alanine-tRNA ligase 2 [Berkelbacteria bacterium GW2011_GWA2_35_9]|uniref:alanine--tRNA ligase n=1 Tax=Berkelbacteria bacterium GW2011_GWA2_35_9 TaxID=1618333 RepID=A0A0G0D4F5_9BACT|nr:MAG: Alanine-tRNA ligase 2 [Berkelbacteria bacterium GW2011_GWA2_35_9]
MNYTSQIIIKKFTDYFEKNGHILYPSSNLLSENDSSVLFTTAGMQQFKEYFTQPELAKEKNIITIQPCLRTSDIEEVGDITHLSSFVMLGNFSFGGYDKEKAIYLAWNFLTSSQYLAVDKKRISATYFIGDKSKQLDADQESKNILEKLKKLGLKDISAQNYQENFWSLGGDNSPAGPTVEFYIDGVEIWNLVFNQYKFTNNQFIKLTTLGIDTGMGVERLEMVLNHYENVFQTDYYLKDKDKLSKCNFDQKELNILLDHFRTIRYLLAENLLPSNKDQGYVLRRLIRRAILILDQKKLSITQLISDATLATEEKNFKKVIINGRKNLLKIYQNKKSISAQDLFDLFQSSGLPLEISQSLIKDENIKLEKNVISEFQKLFTRHQNISRSSLKTKFLGGLENNNQSTIKLHTATHLLLSALKEIISTDIVQKGSNITDQRLRFDYNYDKNLTEDEVGKIENCVNNWIKKSLVVVSEKMTLDKAKSINAEGQFADRYQNEVSVYTIKNGKMVISREICGGPHVKNTNELGSFKIIKVESIAKGIKRIKAVVS